MRALLRTLKLGRRACRTQITRSWNLSLPTRPRGLRVRWRRRRIATWAFSTTSWSSTTIANRRRSINRCICRFVQSNSTVKSPSRPKLAPTSCTSFRSWLAGSTAWPAGGHCHLQRIIAHVATVAYRNHRGAVPKDLAPWRIRTRRESLLHKGEIVIQ